MPKSIKDLLLERSIFDILCDLWFFPRLSLVVKAVFWPFISKPKPELALTALDPLPEDIKEVFLTKGLVNFFSHSMLKIILPNDMFNNHKIGMFLNGEKTEVFFKNMGAKEIQELPVNQDLNELMKVKSKEQIKCNPKMIKNNVIVNSKMMKNFKGSLPGKKAYQWDRLEEFKLHEDYLNKEISEIKKNHDESILSVDSHSLLESMIIAFIY